jgi:hypothetical protein
LKKSFLFFKKILNFLLLDRDVNLKMIKKFTGCISSLKYTNVVSRGLNTLKKHKLVVGKNIAEEFI